MSADLEGIYHRLCLTGTPAAMLERMEDGTLAELVLHLARGGVDRGIPGMISGLAEREAARRFAETKAGRDGAVGEGNVE